MALVRWSAKYMSWLVALCFGAVWRVAAVASSSQRKLVRSEGQASTIEHLNRSRDHLHGFCYSNADCPHSDLCDTQGTLGCANRCLSQPDPQGRRHCMTIGLAGVCAHDGECISGSCDTDDFYGCQNLCLSEQDETGRHCRTRDMGEPCDNSAQCLSGVCDTQSFWGCRDLCVSEPDASGHNRHCDRKRIGETCAHHENCLDGSVCDVDGSVEELGRCKNRCVTKSVVGCEKQHCSPNCPLCLSNLLAQPQLGVAETAWTWPQEYNSASQWVAHPSHRVQRDPDGKSFVMWLTEREDTQLYLRIPASCIEAESCVEVKGTLQMTKLNSARLHIQSGLFTGFPGTKPNVDVVVNGACPTRPDGFPVAGDTGCCYTPEHVGNCTSAPYNKGCESFMAGGLFFGGDEWWSHEHRESTDPDSFDQTTNHQRFDDANLVAYGIAKDFSLEIDFAAEKYKHFEFAGKSWNMNEPLMKFSRDRNCNHIHDWPEASYEFSLKLEPPEDANATIDAEVLLTHLEVNRKKECTYVRPTSQHYR